MMQRWPGLSSASPGLGFVGSDTCGQRSRRASVAPIAMETAAAAALPLRMCRPRFQELFWKHLPRQCLLISLSFVIILSPWFSALAWFPKWTLLPDPGVRGEVWATQPRLGGDERQRLPDHCRLQTGPVSCPRPWEGPELIEVARIMKPRAFEASRPIEAKNNWTNSLSG